MADGGRLHDWSHRLRLDVPQPRWGLLDWLMLALSAALGLGLVLDLIEGSWTGRDLGWSVVVVLNALLLLFRWRCPKVAPAQSRDQVGSASAPARSPLVGHAAQPVTQEETMRFMALDERLVPWALAWGAGVMACILLTLPFKSSTLTIVVAALGMVVLFVAVRAKKRRGRVRRDPRVAGREPGDRTEVERPSSAADGLQLTRQRGPGGTPRSNPRERSLMLDGRPFILRRWWVCAACGVGVAYVGVQFAQEDLLGIIKVVFVALFAMTSTYFLATAWQLARSGRR